MGRTPSFPQSRQGPEWGGGRGGEGTEVEDRDLGPGARANVPSPQDRDPRGMWLYLPPWPPWDYSDST